MYQENINVENSQNTSVPKKKSKFNCEEYDIFLKTVKEGRFVRVGPWKGYSKSILHRCCDPDCLREWSPSPSQVIENDDYFCPSCVLHHRNNVERFIEERLQWTAIIPNTFYVYSITDPKTNLLGVKFGRTQHKNPHKRYTLAERKKLKMKLLFSLRGKLITTTKIENWWKDEAKTEKIFLNFSDKSFHGQSEVIKYDESLITRFIEQSNIIYQKDL